MNGPLAKNVPTFNMLNGKATLVVLRKLKKNNQSAWLKTKIFIYMPNVSNELL